ncbi:MAG: hypothetical protein KatS3mg092_0146 [Patescibacteria group bacterium]|nr:MAG: hypothetical protein KatS3mg092_0146 [Patescibacteria group bacterium]
MNFWQKLLLIFVIIIGFFIRIYKINEIPYGLLPDEASIGYNAYSVLKTGKDEYGIKFPIIFKAFGDQKQPIYIYLTIPFIKIFGLTNFSVRILSVISGTLLIFIIFKLLRLLKFNIYLSILGSFITAISPWMIILSRFSYESNVALLFFLSGIYFLIKDKSKLDLIFSILFLSLTFFTYISFRLITPLITFLIIVLINKKNKKLLLFFLIFFFLFLFLLKMENNSSNLARFNQITNTTAQGLVLEINEYRNFCSNYLPTKICYANANKLIFFTREFIYRFIKSISFDYLFLYGDNEAKYINIDHFGLIPIFLLPFYILGFVKIIDELFKLKFNHINLFIIIGLIITPIPNILVSDPQKIRLSALYPFVCLLIIYGFQFIFEKIKKINYFILYNFIILLFCLYGIFLTINFLFIHINKYEISYYNHVRKLAEYIIKQDKNNIYLIRNFPEFPIIYAFYKKIDPILFQKQTIRKKSDNIGFSHIFKTNNIIMTEKSIDEIYCYLKEKKLLSKTNYYYVINENLIDNKKILKSEKIIYSTNSSLKLIYVFNLNKINNKSVDCSYIKNLSF